MTALTERIIALKERIVCCLAKQTHLKSFIALEDFFDVIMTTSFSTPSKLSPNVKQYCKYGPMIHEFQVYAMQTLSLIGDFLTNGPQMYFTLGLTMLIRPNISRPEVIHAVRIIGATVAGSSRSEGGTGMGSDRDNEDTMLPSDIAELETRKMLMLTTDYEPFVDVIAHDPLHGVGLNVSSIRMMTIAHDLSEGEQGCLMVPDVNESYDPTRQRRFELGLRRATLVFEPCVGLNGRLPHCRYGMYKSHGPVNPDKAITFRISFIWCRGRLRSAFILCRSYTNNAVFHRWNLDRRMALQLYNAI